MISLIIGIHVVFIIIMKVLALISGGKDSIYNLCKCLDEGHQVVALGNLYNASMVWGI